MPDEVPSVPTWHLAAERWRRANSEADMAEEEMRKFFSDPRLLARLQSYLAVKRPRIGELYRSQSNEPVPQWLVDTVLRAPPAQPRRRWWVFKR